MPLPLSNRSKLLSLALAAGAGIGLLTATANAGIVTAATNTAFTDISGTGTSVGTIADDSEFIVTGAALTAAGFSGNGLLAGGMSIRVGNNGGVLWGNSATDTFTNATEIGAINIGGANTIATMAAGNSNFGLPSGNGGLGPRQFLMVLWDDNTPGTGASTKWQVIGGNLIIQWTNEDHFNATGAGVITYEMVVYGGRTIASGLPLVEFIYNDTMYSASQFQNDGGSASIGYKNWGLNAAANDVEFGISGGDGATLSDGAFGSATMHAKVAGWVAAGDTTLPHSVAIKGNAPPPCPYDIDNNGQITPADIAGFVNRWFTSITNGTLDGDFDGNGSVQPADIANFVNGWFNALTNGC